MAYRLGVAQGVPFPLLEGVHEEVPHQGLVVVVPWVMVALQSCQVVLEASLEESLADVVVVLAYWVEIQEVAFQEAWDHQEWDPQDLHALVLPALVLPALVLPVLALLALALWVLKT